MTEYTPSDEQVEAEWIAFVSTPDPDNYWDAISEEDAQGRWSRWLAAHDARVRRDAAREALDGFERVCDKVADRFRAGDSKINVRQRERAAEFAAHYRDTHYPETED